MDSQEVSLRAEGLHLSFGGVQALIDISVDVRPGELLAIIGPNGAGKTALLNSISGFYRPQRGRILFDGHDISRLSAHKRAEMGLARTFQNLALYTGLSTLDNLMSGRHFRMKRGVLAGALFFGPALKEEVAHRRVVEDIIEFLEIEAIRYKVVGSLPYGQRKRVELGRALAMEPKVLLLDEPMAGMNMEEKEDMARFILDVHELRRIPIILIEHDMGVVMDIAQRVVVFDFGRKIAEGVPQEVRKDPQVVKAYLGEE